MEDPRNTARLYQSQGKNMNLKIAQTLAIYYCDICGGVCRKVITAYCTIGWTLILSVLLPYMKLNTGL